MNIFNTIVVVPSGVAMGRRAVGQAYYYYYYHHIKIQIYPLPPCTVYYKYPAYYPYPGGKIYENSENVHDLGCTLYIDITEVKPCEYIYTEWFSKYAYPLIVRTILIKSFWFLEFLSGLYTVIYLKTIIFSYFWYFLCYYIYYKGCLYVSKSKF